VSIVPNGGGKQYLGDDYSAELAAFNVYLVSNDPPDIIIAPWMFPYDSYMEKGVFEDLYPYLDADSELGGRDALVPEALRALDTDGRLYQIASHFSIDTAFGMRAVVGDRTSWTVDEMLAVYDALPEGSGLFANMSAEEALLMLVEADTDRYIDFKNGKCYFGGTDFIKLLEFARLLPNTPPLLSAQSLEEQMASGQAIHDGYVAVSDGKTLAVDWSVRSFFDAQGISRAYGGDIVFVGRPRAEGSGSSFSLSPTMLMSSRSRHKDGAWEFLRSFLTYEAQSAENYMAPYSPGFPTNKAAFDNLITQAMTPKFEAGGTGERAELPLSSRYYGLEFVDVYAASQEEIDQILSLIAAAEGLTRKDNFVSAIVTEEAAPFFAGRRSAEDAARIIQSRVSLYVGERS
jgi:ABC-type glycerol-3-phosphate transport system substrate-binding protein